MTAADLPPDWTNPDVQLACPLCRYNLRGLTEPRCPECGFAFTWAELRDADRDRHPWLFEHAAAGRRARAFGSTYVRAAFPLRFWRMVTPANPVRVGRLLLYWAMANAALVLVMGIPAVRLVVDAARRDLATRGLYAPSPGRPGHYDGPDTRAVQFLADNGTPYTATMNGMLPTVTITAEQLDALAPRVVSAAFAVQVWDEWRDGRRARRWHRLRWSPDRAAGPAAAVVLAWPWLSMAALSVFAASMRRARVRPAHVLRAVVYGCDFALLAVVAAAVLYGPSIASTPVWRPVAAVLPCGPVRPEVMPVVLAVAFCAAVASYRLSVAYARYLRFHRPVLTVVAAQVMVVLAVGVVLMRTMQWF